MMPRYSVRVNQDAVVVEHRARLRVQTLLLGTLGFLYVCFMQGLPGELAHPSIDLLRRTGWMLLIYVPIAILLSCFPLYMRAEVLHCDKEELHLARRRLFRPWHRVRVPTASVEALRLTYHGGRERRHYSVLTFTCGHTRYEMLENITDADAERVLAACGALGAKRFVLPEDHTADAMHQDIAERGWWVKPWKKG